MQKTVKEQILAKPATKDETKVYYLKMMGDYLRYSAEVSTGVKLTEAKKECTKMYEDANMVALSPCSPVRLGLILNLSVFYHDTC